jgi:hypothetical protein
MDNDSVVNQKHTDGENDNEQSIHADIGGMYTERKLAMVNDTDVDMNPHEFHGENQIYIKLDNHLETDAGRFSNLNQTSSSNYES